jgi:hypothetical protein
MTLNEQHRQWHENVVERARRYNQRALGTDVLMFPELSGPGGVHITLIREKHHTTEDIKQAKHSCRVHDDVTGFTVLSAK